MRPAALLALALLPLAHAFTPINPTAADIARAKADPPTAPPTRRAAQPHTHARMTNARRLKLGLPLLRPRNLPHAQPAARGTPTAPLLVARASPSPSSAPSGAPAPPSFHGVIKISAASDSSFLGFVAADTIQFGEFGATTEIAEALTVTIAGLKPGLNSGVDVVSADPNAPFPFVGAITGFANTADSHDVLAAGSFNFAFIAGTLESPPFSPPELQFNAFTSETGIPELTESAVWSVNTVSNTLSATWTNPDSQAAPGTLVFLPGDDANVLLLVGDLAAFSAEFGPPIPVTLSLFATP